MYDDDYEDYSYEDEDVGKKANFKKKILIVLLLLVAVVVIILLLKRCGAGGVDTPEDPVEEFSYEKTLLEAGKNYFEYNEHKMPVSAGECATVDLGKLGNGEEGLGLVNADDFSKCDNTKTYVQVCKLEDGTYQWTPWLACTDKDSESEYDESKEGTKEDLVVDESYVSFTFLPQVLKSSTENLGAVEEIWKDDITYKAYKTLATIKNYSYKDQKWRWNTITKTYYNNQYYPSNPNSKYNLKDSGTDVYKWYTEKAAVKEYYMENGSKAFSSSAPEGYPYKGGESSDAKIVYYYRTKNITKTENSRHYYRCLENANGTRYVDQQVACSNSEGKNTQNPNYTYTLTQFWGCPVGTVAATTPVTQGTLCRTYSDWSAVSTTPCNTTDTNVCQRGTVTYYAWYKLVSGGSKTYYPSGSDSASGESNYYASSPTANAKRDDSTKTTGYKWYYQTEGVTKDYFSEPPSAGATKTDKVITTDWTSWSTNEPASKSYRTIQTKIKIRLQEIKGTTDDNWEALSSDYITAEEMIKLFTDKGYEVTSLADISNNGSIRYQVKLFIRNKKEVSENE